MLMFALFIPGGCNIGSLVSGWQALVDTENQYIIATPLNRDGPLGERADSSHFSDSRTFQGRLQLRNLDYNHDA